MNERKKPKGKFSRLVESVVGRFDEAYDILVELVAGLTLGLIFALVIGLVGWAIALGVEWDQPLDKGLIFALVVLVVLVIKVCLTEERPFPAFGIGLGAGMVISIMLFIFGSGLDATLIGSLKAGLISSALVWLAAGVTYVLKFRWRRRPRQSVAASGK